MCILKKPVFGLLVSLFVVLQSGIASAGHDGISPSGCNMVGVGYWDARPSMKFNCYLGRNGSSYQSNARFVVGVQRILRYSGFYPGPSNDGLYGSQTEWAVVGYQNSSSALSISGIVDSSTWDHMAHYKVIWVASTSGYDYYRFVGDSSRKRQIAVEPDRFELHWIRNMNNTDWMVFNVNDV